MKIVEEFYDLQPDLLEIKSAKYIGDFAIRVSFNDGVNRLVDFKPFLESSLHPSIRKFLNEKLFKQFNLVDGNLNWNETVGRFPLIFQLDILSHHTFISSFF